jgi:hypothetical protein
MKLSTCDYQPLAATQGECTICMTNNTQPKPGNNNHTTQHQQQQQPLTDKTLPEGPLTGLRPASTAKPYSKHHNMKLRKNLAYSDQAHARPTDTGTRPGTQALWALAPHLDRPSLIVTRQHQPRRTVSPATATAASSRRQRQRKPWPQPDKAIRSWPQW